jgi:isochorismate synthase
MSFEELLNQVHRAKDLNKPFVVYRMPEEKTVHVIIQKDNRLEYSEDFSTSGFIMAPFDGTRKTVLFAEDNIEKFNCVLSDTEYADFNASENRVQADAVIESREQHINLVKKGIEGIKNGEFVKTVLSRSEHVRLQHLDIVDIFQRLMSRYQSAFVYVWFHPEIGLWAGASPETLLKTEGAYFQTMSLAGTQKYTDTIDVSWGDKEIKEQQIVTKHISESLEGVILEVSETYTRKAGDLLHLCNDIKGHLPQGYSLKDLIEKLHPTAAVCGLPRKEVQDFIFKEEGYDRSFYTGFLGELNVRKRSFELSEEAVSKASQSNIFVNLRCMQLIEESNPAAIIYIGGGITSESDPLLEWEETVHKSLIMKSVIEG